MHEDRYAATWISHSSINDFLACPRAYYLKNVYRNPQTGRKMSITAPPLALGSVVHDVLETISNLPTEKRFTELLTQRFETQWEEVAGKRGGFIRDETEQRYKARGREMLGRVMKNPGPLKNRAVKIKQNLPQFVLSQEENIILCGKIDWLEYLEDQGGVHIIDFKTGKAEENPTSLQMPIYHLLVHHCQSFTPRKASYWYLNRDDGLVGKNLPPIDQAQEDVLRIARKIKLARQLQKFACPTNGCRTCRPYERILAGEGEHVGHDKYRNDVYLLPPEDLNEHSVIL